MHWCQDVPPTLCCGILAPGSLKWTNRGRIAAYLSCGVVIVLYLKDFCSSLFSSFDTSLGHLITPLFWSGLIPSSLLKADSFSLRLRASATCFAFPALYPKSKLNSAKKSCHLTCFTDNFFCFIEVASGHIISLHYEMIAEQVVALSPKAVDHIHFYFFELSTLERNSALQHYTSDSKVTGIHLDFICLFSIR